MSLPRPALEAEIRAHVEAGRIERATTALLEGYGDELLGYLHAVAPTHADADDVFSAVCEAVWSSLESFEFRSSFRTWMYGVARNQLRDHRRATARKMRRLADPAAAEAVSQIADRIRSTTPPHLKSESLGRLERLRASLDPDDRSLLVLRIDRGLSWNDIAIVLCDEEPAAEDLPRLSARTRKRFERIKARLRALMTEESS